MNTDFPENTSDTLSQYKKLVQSLVEQRQKIIDEYQIAIKELGFKRDRLLNDNLQTLLQMGVSEVDIPHAVQSTGRKFKKLEAALIKKRLLEYMTPGERYTSTPITEFLQISYPEFRDFVKDNPEFIERDGKNKGTYYKLKNTE